MSATDAVETGLSAPRADTACVVLDTNVVLDMLAFRDARCARLAADVEAGELRWLASAHMFGELEAVLPRPAFARYGFDRVAILARCRQLAETRPEPCASPVLRCRDPADQVFLDLALSSGARWLLTHDHDLLSLARHASRRGLSILTPMAWEAERSKSAPGV